MLVSVQELINYMDKTSFTASQQEVAADVLQGVQNELETYLNRPVELVQVREVIKSDYDGVANVSVSPVVKVISFGIASTTQALTFVPSENPYIPPPLERDPLVGPDGRVLDRVGASWGAPEVLAGGIRVGAPFVPYMVEYVAGLNGAEVDGMVNAIKRVAARELEPMTDDTLSLRSGDAEQANDADDRPKGWTEDELKAFERYRRRVIA